MPIGLACLSILTAIIAYQKSTTKETSRPSSTESHGLWRNRGLAQWCREMNKQAMIARMLQRPQGVTRRELLNALGWKAIVQADARQCGLVLRRRSATALWSISATNRGWLSGPSKCT